VLPLVESTTLASLCLVR